MRLHEIEKFVVVWLACLVHHDVLFNRKDRKSVMHTHHNSMDNKNWIEEGKERPLFDVFPLSLSFPRNAVGFSSCFFHKKTAGLVYWLLLKPLHQEVMSNLTGFFLPFPWEKKKKREEEERRRREKKKREEDGRERSVFSFLVSCSLALHSLCYVVLKQYYSRCLLFPFSWQREKEMFFFYFLILLILLSKFPSSL